MTTTSLYKTSITKKSQNHITANPSNYTKTTLNSTTIFQRHTTHNHHHSTPLKSPFHTTYHHSHPSHHTTPHHTTPHHTTLHQNTSHHYRQPHQTTSGHPSTFFSLSGLGGRPLLLTEPITNWCWLRCPCGSCCCSCCCW